MCATCRVLLHQLLDSQAIPIRLHAVHIHVPPGGTAGRNNSSTYTDAGFRTGREASDACAVRCSVLEGLCGCVPPQPSCFVWCADSVRTVAVPDLHACIGASATNVMCRTPVSTFF
jgi:hypothetical protein